MHNNNFNDLYQQSLQNPDNFWADAAKAIDWKTPWKNISRVDFNARPVEISWFEGAKLNVAENCLDRHLSLKANKIAYYCVPDDPNLPTQEVSYSELHTMVCKAANAMQLLGVKAGDRVIIYLPMRIEAIVAMLACARLGAIHCVVFAGFSAQALADRINDAQPTLIITATHGNRGGKQLPLLSIVEQAMQIAQCDAPLWCVGKNWEQQLANQPIQHQAQSFDAENPLFILYTSGSTGKPKGLIHTSGGYLVQTLHSFMHVFDIQDDDTYWCTADIGWITGHSYGVYAPLAAGATSVLFEGVPNYPTPDRCWQIIDELQVTQFYTAPTALRMLMREGDAWLAISKRDSLRVLGSVGEPINPQVWQWYHDVVGKSRCAIVDTWWQTETGAHLITAIPNTVTPKAGAAQMPYFAMRPTLLRNDGSLCDFEEEGALCFAHSWPSQARSIWGDEMRFAQTYFSTFAGYYFTGDAARQDSDGDWWILGRLDDVLNVSGHRIGTAEVESAMVAHETVAEAAAIGIPHEIKGEAIVVFVILNPDISQSDELIMQLKANVRTAIGGFAVPERIICCEGLPKTRSGKIMRRILRKIASGEVKNTDDIPLLGDISSLTDTNSVQKLISIYQQYT